MTNISYVGPATAARLSGAAGPLDGYRPSWRGWQLGFLALVAGLDLLARDELAMSTRPGLDPLAAVVMDTGLNWRLMLYLVLPLYLTWVLRDAGRLLDPSVLTRAGGYFAWLHLAVKDSFSKALPLIASMLGAAVATSLGALSATSLAGGAERILGSASQQLLAAATLCSVVVNLGLLGALVLMGTLALGRFGGGAVAAAIFAIAVTGSAAPAALAPLNLGYGIQPQASMAHYGSALWGLIVPTVVNLGLVLTIAALLESRIHGRAQRASTWATMLAMCGLLALRLLLGEWIDPLEALVGGFYGSGGTPLDYLFVAIVWLAPIWLSTVYAESSYEKLPAELIRSGTTARWFWRSIAPSLAWYPGYLLAVLGGSILLVWLRYGTLPSPEPEIPVGPAALYYQFVVNGTLQGWSVLIAVRTARWAAGAAWGGLTALGTVIAAGAVAPRQPWFPLADLGLGQLFDGRDPAQLTIACLCWLGALSILAIATLTRLSVPLLERNLSQ